MSYVDTANAGIYTVTADGWEQRFVVNLLDDAESNVGVHAQGVAGRAEARRAEDASALFPSRQDLWKVCALAAIALLLLEGALYHREVRGRWPWAAATFRLAVLLCIVGGLLGFDLHRSTDAQTVLFVLDGSDSVSLENRARTRQYVAEAIRGASPQDRYGVVTFGASPVLETPSAANRFPQSRRRRATGAGPTSARR